MVISSITRRGTFRSNFSFPKLATATYPIYILKGKDARSGSPVWNLLRSLDVFTCRRRAYTVCTTHDGTRRVVPPIHGRTSNTNAVPRTFVLLVSRSTAGLLKRATIAGRAEAL